MSPTEPTTRSSTRAAAGRRSDARPRTTREPRPPLGDRLVISTTPRRSSGTAGAATGTRRPGGPSPTGTSRPSATRGTARRTPPPARPTRVVAPAGRNGGRPTRSAPAAAPRPTAQIAGAALGLVRAFLDRTTPRGATLEALPDKVTRSRTARRLRWMLVMLVLLFALVLSRLAIVQLVSPDEYEGMGEAQRIRSERLAADRGTIRDRNGTELALSLPTKSVFVDPKLVEDAPAEARRVAEVLRLDAADVEQKMTAANRFGYLERQITEDEHRALLALKEQRDENGEVVDLIPSVAFVDEPRRVLPSGEVAKSIVGQVDVDGNGLSGLEKMFADELTGTPGKLVLEQNPSGRTIAPGGQQLIPAVKGNDLELTLDRSLQFETERILGDQVREAGAKGGIAVVMKPDTGEILSVANMVSDPETGAVTPGGNNAAFTTVYEPGSVMKLVPAAAALERGKVRPDSEIVVPDTLQICDAQFSEHDYHGTVSWPVSKIISQSSNTGTIKMAQMVGKDEVYRFMRDFGFGRKTAVDFPNEQSGSLMKPEDWWCSSMGTIPIGQGVSVTPLQMLVAYNTIANGGVYVAPKLVNAVVGPDGSRRSVVADPGHRVVSRETASQMNLMLRDVVLDGTGKKAAIDGYNPAGKTGTARKPQPNGGYMGPDGIIHYQATFVGFVPAEAPALSIIVIIDDPSKEGIFGGVVAAPAFSKIAETALRQFAVPPPATDLVKGGAPVQGAGPVRGPDAVSGTTIVQTTADGRVRGPAAGTVTSSTVPGGTAATGAAPVPTTTTPRSGTSTTTASRPVSSTTTTRPVTTTTVRSTPTTAPRRTGG